MKGTSINTGAVAVFLLILCSIVFAETLVSINLTDIDSGTTSPAGNYRWMDTADQVYSSAYQSSYNYTQASVQVDYYTNAATLHGTMTATNLKPNFTYQFKLLGDPIANPTVNEKIGLTGRWWQEEWGWDDIYGGIWMNGHNLNNKGDGSSPNPNDNVYYSLRDVVDLSNSTGKKYRFTAYRVIDYFITDEQGNATLDFEADSCYHVLFKTTQRSRTANDGPVKTSVFDADVSSPAYDTDYGEASVGVFGEWERLPVGGIFLDPGTYQVDIMLTEESFHGSGLAGGWAAAMGGEANFTILPASEVCLYTLAGDLNDDCKVDLIDFSKIAENWLIDCNIDSSNPACVPK
jgi:hypothetical protein